MSRGCSHLQKETSVYLSVCATPCRVHTRGETRGQRPSGGRGLWAPVGSGETELEVCGALYGHSCF